LEAVQRDTALRKQAKIRRGTGAVVAIGVAVLAAFALSSPSELSSHRALPTRLAQPVPSREPLWVEPKEAPRVMQDQVAMEDVDEVATEDVDGDAAAMKDKAEILSAVDAEDDSLATSEPVVDHATTFTTPPEPDVDAKHQTSTVTSMQVSEENPYSSTMADVLEKAPVLTRAEVLHNELESLITGAQSLPDKRLEDATRAAPEAGTELLDLLRQRQQEEAWSQSDLGRIAIAVLVLVATYLAWETARRHNRSRVRDRLRELKALRDEGLLSAEAAQVREREIARAI